MQAIRYNLFNMLRGNPIIIKTLGILFRIMSR